MTCKQMLSTTFSMFLALSVTACTTQDSGVISSDSCDTKYSSITKEIRNHANSGKPGTPYTKQLERKVSRSISKCPKHAGLRVIMANIQAAHGKNIQALSHISLALEFKPTNAQAMNVKGMILSMNGQADKALELVKRSLKLAPENPAFHFNYCSLLESYQKYEEAIEACSNAIVHQDDPAPVYYIRARSFEALGMQRKADADYSRAE